MLARFKQDMDTLLPHGSRVLAAVSGGIDSMCMLELMDKCGYDYGIAHCNFHLRGDDSDADAGFVNSWAERHGVKCHNIDFDTVEYASTRGISIEMAARELRYEWFSKLCIEEGYYAVSVAHNANDNAETLILNLLRGTGGRGLRGMSASASNPCRTIRPMLGFSREEIFRWMKDNGFEWREDRTNAETIYKRNKIRLEVFPLFGQINPSFIDTLGRDMKHFALENDIVEDYWLAVRPSLTDSGGNILLDNLLREKHWKYLLYRLTEDRGLNADVFDSLIRSIENGQNISGKVFGPLVASHGKLMVDDASSVISDVEIKCYPRPEGLNLKRADGSLLLDASKLAVPLTVRHWKEGDWMVPFGMKGRKKLSDIFSDLKLSVPEKRNTLVIEYQGVPGRIAAIVGQRIDDSLKVTEDTTDIIEIKPIYK